MKLLLFNAFCWVVGYVLHAVEVRLVGGIDDVGKVTRGETNGGSRTAEFR